MTHYKFDHLLQAITANIGTLSVVYLTQLNEILQLVLLLSSLGFATIKWRQYVIEQKNKKKSKKLIGK